MGDANYASIGYTEEESWGVTPAAPRLTAARITGEDLMHEKETIQSQEVRDDRQISDLVEVGVQAAGGVEFELSYGGFITALLGAALLSTPQVIAVAGVTAAIDATSSTLTGVASDFDDVPVGATVKITGAATAGNNGLKLVIGKSVDGSVLTFAANSFTIDEASPSVTLSGNHMRNGTTRRSLTMERRLQASAGGKYYQQFRGMTPDSLTLNFESKQIVTGSASFIGSRGEATDTLDALVAGTAATQVLTAAGAIVADDEVVVGDITYTLKAAPTLPYEVEVGVDDAATLANLAAAINGQLSGTTGHPLVTATSDATTLTITAKAAGTGANAIVTTETGANIAWGAATMAGGADGESYAAATTTPVMNATRNIGTFLYDNAASTECFKSLTLQIANGLRGKDCMGTVGNFDLGVGTFELTGSLSAYFIDQALYQKFLDHADVALSFRVTDALGNVYAFTIPRMKLGSDNTPVEGRNTDVMNAVDFTAIRDAVTGATLIVDYFPA